MKWISFTILLFFFSICTAQKDTVKIENNFRTDKDAKFAVYKIAQYSGLTPDFILVEDNSIKSALAYIKNKKRYIRYNPNFMRRVNDSSQTDWAAISVLAHEIGHHLLGHTITPDGSNPGDELGADRYSGFILYQMGATLEESLRCIETEGNPHPTKTHPPKDARVNAITNGWTEAKNLSDKKLNHFYLVQNDSIEEKFIYLCEFIGDENKYYVNEKFEVVWYDNYATPIVIGNLTNSQNKSYRWEYIYDDTPYGIDANGSIWLITTTGMTSKVGKLTEK